MKAGGLMSYRMGFPDVWRRAATYVDKLLKGAEPAALPVEQPTKCELVINFKTAQALGLTIPSTVLFQADEVRGSWLRVGGKQWPELEINVMRMR